MVDASLQRIEEIKLSEDNNINFEAVEQILKNNIRQSELPEFFFSHMAGIIVEEIPGNGNELYDLIGEFIQNGNKINKLTAQKACNEIASTLIGQKIIKENLKFHLVAEKLNAPIQLKQVQLMKGDDINSGYEDAFRGIKKEANTNDQMDPQDLLKNKKKKEKESNKAQELFMRYQNEQQSNTKKLPPIQVRHQRNQEGKSMDLTLDKITLIVGGRALLEDTSVRLTYGRKYGLIGRNGIGKTCFMNALARSEFDKTPQHLQILLVEQEIQGIDKTPLEYVLETDIEREKLLQEEQTIINKANSSQKDDQRLVEINKQLELIEAHVAESKAMQILGGLGFTQEMMRQATKNLSGGWRMRVALARALFVQPDILLLDEPTNHLDLDAVMWLEDYIVSSKICIVVVSHAREFLNVVCNEIIHFFECTLTYYKGNYDQFEKTRSERLKMKLKQYEAQQLKLAHMQEFIDRFRYNAKRASLVQSRLKAINKMELIDEVVEDPSCVFIFPTPDKLRPPLLKIEDGSFGYSKEKAILKGLNLTVDCESRFAIVGANGVGKSTLLRLLVGDLTLFEGNQYRNNRLRCSIFTQHHVDQLDLMLSPLEQFMRDFPGSSPETYRGHLGSFGITGNLALRPNYLLSGGQKSRVAFALAVYNNPHVLILDEPTNHLDIDAVNALIIALNNYSGGVVIVSHDQHLISTVCDQIWYIKEQRLKRFNGDFEDYRIALASNKL